MTNIEQKALVERLRADVFSKDALQSDMHKYNPLRINTHNNLHIQAADLIEALVAEVSHWMGDAQRLLKSGYGALDRIEALEAENERLRRALLHADARLADWYCHAHQGGKPPSAEETRDAITKVRAALAEKQ